MIELAQEEKPILEGGKFPNVVKGYYDYFERVEKEREVKDIPTFAPSYLTTCSRQIYYKKTGEKPSNPIELPARFKMYLGKLAHEGLQTIMKEIGAVVESELHHEIEYDGLGFNYFLDLVIDWKGEKIVIEIKTIYGRGFDFIKQLPKEDHLMQTCSYMAFEKIKKAIILYVGRDNGYMIQHNIESNSKLMCNGQDISEYRQKWLANVKRLKTLKQAIIDRQIPERNFDTCFIAGEHKPKGFQRNNNKYKPHWSCSYCQYMITCWKDVIEKSKQDGGAYYGTSKIS